MKKNKIIVALLIGVNLIAAQGLFESAATTEEAEAKGYELNGFVRSTGYLSGEEVQSVYGEAGLLLQANSGNWGSAFTELRFRSGHEYGVEFFELNVSEAYVDVSFWRFDLRLGKQIVVWGRADGFNPTNNITPQNTTVRSPDSDDMRIGNFLSRAYFNLSPQIRLEGIWVPQYSPTVLAFKVADLPDNITIGEGAYPDAGLGNSAFAARLNLEFSAFDGSISYARGYNPMPGIKLKSIDMATAATELIPAAYQQQVFGLDFSTAIGSWGLRGESAYRITEEQHDGLSNYYIPYSDLYFVVGLDRVWGDFSLLVQYVGRHQPDFEKLVIPSDPLQSLYPQLENYNRLFANQTDQYRQAITLGPTLSLFYETLNLELFAMYDLTTGETMVVPQVVYKPADGMAITLGGNYYQGDSGTLYDLIEDSYNSVFCELKLAF